jgi:hypothetical protein
MSFNDKSPKGAEERDRQHQHELSNWLFPKTGVVVLKIPKVNKVAHKIYSE